MAEEPSPLHIDTDWKKQAQEEKRRLAEDEQKRAAERDRAAAASAPAVGTGAVGSGSGGGAGLREAASAEGTPGARAARGRGAAAGRERAMPEASFATLVNSLVTQSLLHLGDLTPRGVEPQINLDLAKFNVDLLAVLEEKTKNNLTADEQKLLDSALYEVRMRFVSVASAYATV
jgi:hypothetical protein